MEKRNTFWWYDVSLFRGVKQEYFSIILKTQKEERNNYDIFYLKQTFYDFTTLNIILLFLNVHLFRKMYLDFFGKHISIFFYNELS
jgi:hypothetical protein